MSKVITDEKQVDEVLNRGVEKVYPTRDELKKKMMSGERLRLYCGFDPSAPALHVGNAILIGKLGQFQKLGHEVIFLIGGFTGMIGDPTDKMAARSKLTREEVMSNATNFTKQAEAYLDFGGENPALIKYNNDWNDKVSFKDLIELASNFTVQQMITRDMFQKRLADEKPIFLHEFLYPLAQAYDSVFMDVDLEVGGNDQMFNMMCGRDLMKSLGKKDKSVLTMKLLADNNGKKMGKSEGNAFFLDDTANDMYGKVMSWTDGVLASAFELCTEVDMTEVRQLISGMESGSVNPRDLKMRLAYEVTKINHGENGAAEAQDNFVKTVQNKEVPTEIETRQVAFDQLNIVDLLILLEMASSKTEARRLIEQGGIKIGESETMDTVLDPKTEVTIKDGLIIQRGKRQYIKIAK